MTIVFLVWGLANHRLSPKSWSAPPSYAGDDVFVLGSIKAASEFELLPFLSRTISRLGAPYAANWNDFPMFEVIPTIFMGMVARWSNLITAWSAGMLLSHLISALAFYAACRLLRFRRDWSAAGALLWAFSFYHNTRCQGHLLICFDYTVPLGIVCCWLMTASRRFRVGGPIFWLSILTGCAIGLGNPYNMNMWLQFVCLGIGFRFLIFRRKADLLAGGLVVGAALLSFLAINFNVFACQIVHGQNQSGLARGYNQLELGGLKPIELFLPPPGDRLVWLTDLSRKYGSSAVIKGEIFSPYLGVVGIAALVWLFGEFMLRTLNLRKGSRRLPLYAFLCSWVVLYASIGGLNGLVGLFGMMLFRSSNRFSIFIAAVCLLFLVSRMSRVVRNWNRFASYALAAGVGAIGLLDQLPLTNPSTAATASKQLGIDRAYARALEERLPRGAMIFQLPIMEFPEADAVRGCDVYDHLRPYLWTKTLHVSFGSVKGRTREAWQEQVTRLPLDQTVEELERYGFAGIYLNRKAWKDHGELMLKELAKCGKSQLIEDEGHDQVCVVLNPSPKPAWPHSDDAAQIVYASNWSAGRFELSGLGSFLGFRACGRDSSLYFINDRPQVCAFHLTGTVVSASARRVDIQFQGETIWSQQLEANDGRTLDLHLNAQPGRNYLYFRSDRKPEPRPSEPQGIRVAQGIVNLQIVRDPPTGP
jgi:hypothetical protein